MSRVGDLTRIGSRLDRKKRTEDTYILARLSEIASCIRFAFTYVNGCQYDVGW